MIPILIPAFEPDHELPNLIEKLVDLGITCIIVVNDGSGPGSKEIFEKVRNNKICHLCTHATNLGKGHSIKTGLSFALTNFPELTGVVTADADGQHLPEDIMAVHRTLSENPRNLILGCRSFGDDIPLRSKLGNEITKIVFHLLSGSKVSDTQTGLRGIPGCYIHECIKLDGERYEYEINMLASTRKNKVLIKEVPISTVYIEENRSSHFNPVLDSIRIYFVLFRFLISSLSTALIDFVVFIICSNFGLSILLSIIVSRLVAGNYNFLINKKIVFRSESNALVAFAKYWLLVIVLGSISYLGIWLLVNFAGFNKYLSKVLIESALFLVSFTVQRTLIFSPYPD